MKLPTIPDDFKLPLIAGSIFLGLLLILTGFFLIGGKHVTWNLSQPVAGSSTAITQANSACLQLQAEATVAEAPVQVQIQTVNNQMDAITQKATTPEDIGKTVPGEVLAARGGPTVLQQFNALGTQASALYDQLNAIQAKYACS